MRDIAHFDECPINAFDVYCKAALKLIQARVKLLRQGARAGHARNARCGSSFTVLPGTHGEQIQKQTGQITQAVSGAKALSYGAELNTGLGERVQQRIHLLNLDAQGFKGFLGRQAGGVGGARNHLGAFIARRGER